MSKSSKNAWEIAAKLLAGHDFSDIEMRARLLKRGCDSEEIEDAIVRLSGLGYLVQTGNDREKLCQMARAYIEKKNKTEITPSLIRSVGAYLIRKGFEIDLVNDYLQQLSELGDQ